MARSGARFSDCDDAVERFEAEDVGAEALVFLGAFSFFGFGFGLAFGFFFVGL